MLGALGLREGDASLRWRLQVMIGVDRKPHQSDTQAYGVSPWIVTMNRIELKRALEAATGAARASGALMLKHWRSPKKVTLAVQHDIKLDLDVRSQKLIERRLRQAFPEVALLGEEGVSGGKGAAYRWVVDPIDGTVNFAYQIPHACVSIALQELCRPPSAGSPAPVYRSILGVVYDPFCDELWTAIRGQGARLNGRPTRVSKRTKLVELVIALGFAKVNPGLESITPAIAKLAPRVRKIRLMGSAALDLVYVASGRMDAYLETGVKLWDIAAGGLILECAGGEFYHREIPGEGTFAIIANNGLLRAKLMPYL